MLQSCLNACQELESWIENGLVLFLVSLLTLLCVLPQVVALAAAVVATTATAATSKSRRSSCTARDYFALNIVLSLQWMARKEHKKRKVVEGSVGVGVEKGLCMALWLAVVMKDYLVGEWTSRVECRTLLDIRDLFASLLVTTPAHLAWPDYALKLGNCLIAT